MMNIDEIYTEIGAILRGLGMPDGGGKPQGQPLLAPGGAMDSLTAMRFIREAERRFNVDILDDLNLDCMHTTDSLAAYIVRKGSYGEH